MAFDSQRTQIKIGISEKNPRREFINNKTVDTLAEEIYVPRCAGSILQNLCAHKSPGNGVDMDSGSIGVWWTQDAVFLRSS